MRGEKLTRYISTNSRFFAYLGALFGLLLATYLQQYEPTRAPLISGAGSNRLIVPIAFLNLLSVWMAPGNTIAGAYKLSVREKAMLRPTQQLVRAIAASDNCAPLDLAVTNGLSLNGHLDGWTLLQLFTTLSAGQQVECALSYPSVNLEAYGRGHSNALTYALLIGEERIAALLLAAGANSKAGMKFARATNPDPDGRYLPVHFASSVYMLKLLDNAGADLNASTQQGLSRLDMAKRDEEQHMVAALQQALSL